MINPLRPVRLALLWLLAGIPLENHTAAIQSIEEGHQQQLARLRRPAVSITHDITATDPVALDAAARSSAVTLRGGWV